MPVECFTKTNLPGLANEFNKRIKGIDDPEKHIEIGRQLALEYHKQLHGELNKFKKSIYGKDFKAPAYVNNYHQLSEEINSQSKTKENAIPIGEPAKVHVDETSGNSGEVGTRVPESKEPAQTQGAGEEKSVPVEEGEGKTTKITHEYSDEMRSGLGLNERKENETETNENLQDRVRAKMKSGDITVEILYDKISKGEPIGKEGETALLLHQAKLESELDGINPSSKEYDAKLQEIQAHLNKSDASGSFAGGQLQARQQEIATEDTIGKAMVNEMNAHGVSELTDEQKSKVISEFNEMKELKSKLEIENKALSEKNANLEAEAKLKTLPKKTSGTKDYAKDRAAIKQAIADKLKASRGKLSSSVLLGAERYIEIAPDVMKLVGSYVEEGVHKLADVVKAVHADLSHPDISEQNIRDIIAGKYDKERPTRNEAKATLRELKTQQQLLNKLDELNTGKIPEKEPAKVKRNQEIESLRRQIGEHPGTKGDEYKKSLADKIVEIQDQIDKNDFEPEKKSSPTILKDEHTRTLEDRLAEITHERDLRRAKAELDNRSKKQKAIDNIANVASLPRSLMSSADLSAVLRQAVVPTIAHPVMAAKAFKQMIEHLGSQKEYDRWFRDIKKDVDYDGMQSSHLYISDPHDPAITAREEAFMSNLAEKIPILGPIVKASERAYVSYLNQMRVSLYKHGAELLRESGTTIDNDPKAYEGLASWANNSTGRGGMIGAADKSAPLLNSIFFSPRLIASRLNMLGLSDVVTAGHGYYSKLPIEIRKQAALDMLKFIGVGIGALKIASAAGAEVETDPRSSDFGKVKVGNTRYDAWGGFQPYARLITQLVTTEKKSTATGKIQDLTSGKFGAPTTKDDAIDFAIGKLSPAVALGFNNLIVHKVGQQKIVGKWTTDDPNEIAISDQLRNNFLPLLQSDVGGAYKDGGWQNALPAAAASILGIGVNTYSTDNKKSNKASSKVVPAKKYP